MWFLADSTPTISAFIKGETLCCVQAMKNEPLYN